MTTDTWQVGASSDDCQYLGVYAGGGDWFSLTHTEFAAGYYSNDYNDYRAGARFTSVNIPQGATISSAYLKIMCQTSTSGDPVLTNITGEDVDDSATFSTKADFLGRARTDTIIPWDNIPSWTAGIEYQSPDIGSVVQEIVNRGGWSSGNDLTIFWEDDGSAVNGAFRVGESYDASSSDAPKLEVTYVTVGGQPYISRVQRVTGMRSWGGISSQYGRKLKFPLLKPRTF